MLRKLAYSLLCLSLPLQNLILTEAETENQTEEINEHFEAKGINVHYRTIDEIRTYIENNAPDSLLLDYATEPDTVSAPYAPGSLSDAYLEDALKSVNVVRYIAGLDPVEMNSSYNDMCQAGALVDAVYGNAVNDPDQPEGMDDELFEYGFEALGNSIVAPFTHNLSSAVYNYWANDTSTNNLRYRRWLLHAPMKQTGFGHVDQMAVMYTADNKDGASELTDNVWPAQNMPIEYFSDGDFWSICTGDIEDPDMVSVYMTDSDNIVYSFDSIAGDFGVDNDTGYGEPGVIYWRPKVVDYEDGDVFHVEIDGLASGKVIEYDVSFFSLFDEKTVTMSETDVEMSVGEKKTVYPVYSSKGMNDAILYAGYTHGYPEPIKIEVHRDCLEIEAIAEGRAFFTVRFRSKMAATFNLQVVADGSKPTGITFGSDTASVKYGNTIQLSTSVTPESADQSVTYTSSDPSIAEVDQNGNVRGIKPGKAMITASTVNGLTATCEVRVLFTDVADAKQYFYEPVYWAVDNGITVGAGGPGKFSPNAPCTREQIVTFLWRLMGEPEPESYLGFSDVKESDWFYKPISWAASKGITVGLNDGTGRFGVGQPCTREQCVTFLYRAADKPAVGTHQEFTDVTSDRYYYDAISWAASKEITVGLNDGTGRFGVGQKCTRAMIVTFLQRFDKTR